MNELETSEFLKFYEELLFSFHSESDRGVVLVVGSLIENALYEEINNRLLSRANSDDLVSRAISNFGVKIDLSYRLGVITPPERRIYHQLRKLRNDCAHKIGQQNFETDTFKVRVENIISASEFLWEVMKNNFIPPNKPENIQITTIHEFIEVMGWRYSFEMFFSLVIAHKKASATRVVRITPLYNAGDYE